MTTYTIIFSTAWLLALALAGSAALRSRTLFDLGLISVVIFGGYYLLPSIVAQFAELPGYEVEAERIILLMKYGTGFVLAFGLAYYWTEKRAARTTFSIPGMRSVRPDEWKLALIMFAGFEILHFAITVQYIDFSAEYTATYEQARSIPDGIRQLHGYLGVLASIAEIVLIRALKHANPRTERYLLALLLIFHLIQSLVTQSRQYLVRFLMILVFQTGIDRARSRVPVSLQVAGIVTVIVVLNVMAMLRGIGEGAEPTALTAVNLLVPSEFISVYLNAYFLAGLHLDGALSRPPGIPYLSDLLSFVPAAAAPWQKIDLTMWFVNEYFAEYAERGGAFAFGTLAEALVYFGWLSVFLQAIVLGVFIGWLSGSVKRKGGLVPFWLCCLYLLGAAWIYIPLRVTSFSFMGSLFHGFVVPYFICLFSMRVLRELLPHKVRREAIEAMHQAQ